MRGTRRQLAFVVVVLVVVAALAPLLAAADARAQDVAPPGTDAAVPPSAAELKKSGNEKMVDSDFVGALADYRRALAIAPDDLALYYNIGRAEGLVGRHPQALAALTTFDERAPAALKARIAKFPELLAETRAHVAYLTVTCPVPKARVQLGVLVLGEAPLSRIAVETGTHDLRIEAEGYLADARRIALDGAQALTVDCRLLPRSTSGTFVVDVAPAGAKIAIDGKRVGDTHVEVPLPAGSHRVVAERPGYETSSMPFIVSAGAVKKLDIPLQKETVPITGRWWFWAGVGVVVAGGVAVTAAIVSERSADKGTIEPKQLGAPLQF